MKPSLHFSPVSLVFTVLWGDPLKPSALLPPVQVLPEDIGRWTQKKESTGGAAGFVSKAAAAPAAATLHASPRRAHPAGGLLGGEERVRPQKKGLRSLLCSCFASS